MEAAVPAFDAREATGFQHLLAAAFALDGEHAFFHLDVDFLRRHARQVGVEDEPGGFLLDVNARHPLAGHDRGLVRGKRSAESRVGTECVSPCRSRWSPYHSTKKTLT